MVVVMNREATEADIERVAERVRDVGGEAFVSRGTVHTIIGLVGDTSIFRASNWTTSRRRPSDPRRQAVQDGRALAPPEPTVVSVGPTSSDERRRSRSSPVRAPSSEEQAFEACRA